MEKNTISVRAYIATGEVNDILEEASPHTAIEEYFMPDMRPPVEAIVIRAITEEGQVVTLSIGQKSISASIR